MNARVASVAGVEPAPSATEPLLDDESRELLRDLRRTGPAHDAAVGRLHAVRVLEEQDRSRWNRDQIAEALSLVTDAFKNGAGPFALQAAIAAEHSR